MNPSSHYLLIIFLLFLFHCSNGSNDLIPQSCRKATEPDPNLSYDFCVASLEAISNKGQPTSLEDLVVMSIELTKSNATDIISKVLELLKDQSLGPYAKACLKDCFDLYKDSLSDLEDAVVAFKSMDLHTANIKVSAALDGSVTCEDQFKDKKGETSPLTNENHVYFQLNVIPLAFINMCGKHS